MAQASILLISSPRAVAAVLPPLAVSLSFPNLWVMESVVLIRVMQLSVIVETGPALNPQHQPFWTLKVKRRRCST